MAKTELSKSTFIRALQCLKSVYLNKNRPFLRDHLEARQLNKFERGHEIGSLAWKLFPGGIDCSPKHPAAYAKAAAKTTELIRRGAKILYEAVFEYDGIRVLPDILVLNDSQIRMYEVKGSLNISQTYILDAALQYYVISGAGYTPSQTFILHVNKNYIYEGGEIHPEDFFVFQDVTAEVIQQQNFIELKIPEAKAAVNADKSPKIPIGPHCYLPYPCDFMGLCWKSIPADSPLYLNSIDIHSRFRLVSEGYSSISRIPLDSLDNELLKTEVEARINGKPIYKASELQKLLQPQKHQVYLKILFIENAVPRLAGTRPFEPLPIAWIAVKENGSLIMGDSENQYQVFSEIINLLRNFLTEDDQLVFWGKPMELLIHQVEFDLPFLNLESVFQSENLYLPFYLEEKTPENIASQLGIINDEITTMNDDEAIRAWSGESSKGKFNSREIENHLKMQLFLLRELYRYAAGFIETDHSIEAKKY